MRYSERDVMQFIRDNGIADAELRYTDLFGAWKSIIVPAEALGDVFAGGYEMGGLRLVPDPDSITVLPAVCTGTGSRGALMYCGLRYPDGTGAECDGRTFLCHAAEYARGCGYRFRAGAELCFLIEEDGSPADQGGLGSAFPENRIGGFLRELCGVLGRMGVAVESAYHGAGPGQAVVRIVPGEPAETADRIQTAKLAAKYVAFSGGRQAVTEGQPLRLRLCCAKGAENVFTSYRGGHSPEARAMAGAVMERAGALSAISGCRKGDVSWGPEEGAMLRLPLTDDPGAGMGLDIAAMDGDPYFFMGALVYICIEGVRNGADLAASGGRLPESPEEAAEAVRKLGDILPEEAVDAMAAALRGEG